MNDKDRNLRRWLMEKPCVFKSPLTKRKIEINIGKMQKRFIISSNIAENFMQEK